MGINLVNGNALTPLHGAVKKNKLTALGFALDYNKQERLQILRRNEERLLSKLR